MRLRGRTVGALMVWMAMIAAACSSESASRPALMPAPDLDHDPVTPEPEVFESGIVTWGAGEQQQFSYEVSEVLGFVTSVTIQATGEDRMSVRSANQQGPDDVLWLAVLVYSDEAPAFVFGGVSAKVDTVTVANQQGTELDLEPVQIDGRDWSLITIELPPSWSTGGDIDLDAVAMTNDEAVDRERLTSG